MATKRTTRIDPNDAFKAIVGQGTAEVPTEQVAPAPQELAVGEGRAEPRAAEPPEIKKAAPTVHKRAQTAHREAAAPAAADAGPSEPPAFPGSMEAMPAPPDSPDPATPGRVPFVQKGYYITPEQARQLAVYAAVNGLDKSSVLRSALDLFFSENA